ncbi:MAG: hypothetical protein E7637_02940 [Ruminococcaceae bacterium]|nr:hypothetical protein [Oscillospiraceae bacterium]
MNMQRKNTPNAATRPNAAPPPRKDRTGESSYGRRKRPNAPMLRWLRIAMLGVMGCIVLTALLLLILPLFRVTSLEVTGSRMYEKQEILDAAELYVGQELFAIGSDDAIRERIYAWETNGYIVDVHITRRFGKIKLTVIEKENVMYTQSNGRYYVLDGNLCLLYVTDDVSRLEGLPQVTLPTVTSFQKGKPASFAENVPDTAYISSLLEEMNEQGIWERVTSIDFSKKYNVSYVLEGACRVQLGKVSDLSVKFSLVEEIMSRKNHDYQSPAVVDVSNTGKPTYRPLSESASLLGG